MSLDATLKNLERRGRFREMALALDGDYPVPRTKDAEILYWTGVTMGRLGKADGLRGAQALARHLLAEARDLFSEEVRRAECDSRIGMCGWRDGQYRQAEVSIRKALSGISESDIEQQAIFNTNLSIVLCDQERYDGALVASANALSYAAKTDVPYIAGLALMENGRAHRLVGNKAKAHSFYEQAMAAFESAENNYMFCLVLNNLADLSTQDNELNKSADFLRAARSLARELNDVALFALISETQEELISAMRSF